MKIKLHTIFLAVFAFLTGSVLFTMSSSAEIIGQVDWVTETYLEGYAWDTEAPVSLNLTLQIKKQDSTEPVKTMQTSIVLIFHLYPMIMDTIVFIFPWIGQNLKMEYTL